MMRMPTPGEILPPMLQDMLQMTTEQKKKLEALQKKTDAELEGLMTEEQKKLFKELKERGNNGFQNGPPGVGPGGPIG